MPMRLIPKRSLHLYSAARHPRKWKTSRSRSVSSLLKEKTLRCFHDLKNSEYFRAFICFQITVRFLH